MHILKELLLLAGKLANSCENLLHANLHNFSDRLVKMEQALNTYDSAILNAMDFSDNENYQSEKYKNTITELVEALKLAESSTEYSSYAKNWRKIIIKAEDVLK